MLTLFRLLLISTCLILTNQSFAIGGAVEFSADAFMTTPQQPEITSKIYVGKEAVRTESNINNQKMIEIAFPGKGLVVLINTQQKAYKEIKKNKSVTNETKVDNNPCDQMPNAQCQSLGKEKINGIETEKWQVISNSRGRQMRTLHWIDVKRKLALREFFPDGSVAELKMVLKEKISDRNTEKWQRTMSRPDGSTMVSFQWYDPELKMAIREALPGGYLRELKNIKIAKQPGELFEIPKDYTKIENQDPYQSSYQP